MNDFAQNIHNLFFFFSVLDKKFAILEYSSATFIFWLKHKYERFTSKTTSKSDTWLEGSATAFIEEKYSWYNFTAV